MPETAIALKEWAAVIEALRSGRQIMVMRKGGIREETKDFQVESESFYLYPTYEHQRTELFKPEFQARAEAARQGWSSQDSEAVIGCYAELAEDILIETQEQLDKLRELHVWTDRFAEERLKWKRTKPLHVMLLKVYELDKPVSLPIRPEYNGCKSWIGLPSEPFDGAARRPVLTEEAFADAVSRVKEALK